MCGSGSALERKVTSTHEASMVRELQKQTVTKASSCSKWHFLRSSYFSFAEKKIPPCKSGGWWLTYHARRYRTALPGGASILFRLQSKFMVSSDLQTMAVRSLY